MEDIILYIDDYFAGALTDEEKRLFEKRIETDEVFAEQVALYISARQSIYDELLTQKKQQWNAGNAPILSKSAEAERGTVRRKMVFLIGTAVAASVLLYFGWKSFSEPKPEQLADSYINQHFNTISISMDGDKDSMQLAGSFFNEKKYPEAEKIYFALQESPEYGGEAIKNLGIVYLLTNKFDSAIGAFDKLIEKRELFNNPGSLYKAIVLLKRNNGKDKESAIGLLEKIAEGNSTQKQEAEKIVQKLK